MISKEDFMASFEKKEERMSKFKHVKFCCSRCCNSSSHGDLIRGGLQSHSEKFISISRSKTRAVSLSPPLSLSLHYSHEVHTLSVRSAFCRQRAQRVNKKKGHSFRPFWRRWDANTPVSFSLVLFFFPLLFRRYLSFLYFHDFESQQ